jgi:hypothetical protein
VEAWFGGGTGSGTDHLLRQRRNRIQQSNRK